MTYILCKWLNTELRLSQVVETKTFARDFSNGFLIGEILHKYHLQTDFSMFNKDDNKSSKVNNFSRLKPTLQMIGVSLDETTVRELMERKQGVASHLIYELYVALEKKKKGFMGGSVADMIPNAPSAQRRLKEQVLYSEKLHRGHDIEDIKPSQISQLQDEDQKLNSKFVDAEAAQQNKPLLIKDNIKRRMHMSTTIKEGKALKKQKEQQRREKQTKILQNEMKRFEENTRKLTISASSKFNLAQPTGEAVSILDIVSRQHFEYIVLIRQRLKEEVFTLTQRERRAAQFSVEQSKARIAEQNTLFEKSLVKRLTQQTEMEKRQVEQLLQRRAQKDVFIKNSLTRQQQFQQRREEEFQDALEREAALLRQERLANSAEIQRKVDMCKKLAAERKKKRYMKHFSICKEIMGQIVDMVTKTEDDRLLPDSLIPETKMKEWNKENVPRKLSKQDVLKDFKEYENMVREWARPEKTQLTEIPPAKTYIFDCVIKKMRNIVHPPSAFPHFILKACVLGKSCSGKTACLDKIAQAHALHILSTDKLVEEVLKTDPSKDELTKWSLLGEAVNKVMTEGKQISSELHVAIITEAIRRLPANSGWILDGFPEDITQAHLLEKALGGSVEEVGEVPPKVSAPALDLALILDVTDKSVASQAAKQTRSNKNELAVISSRIAPFEETWPQLEQWFGEKQNILVRLTQDADVDEKEVFDAVESILQQIKKPTEGPLESSFNHDNTPSFVEEPLPLGPAASLCLHWETVCKLYVNNVKAVLQELRLQRTAFDTHFFNLRDEFALYLNRTDPKQDLISKWQKDYNKSPLHMRQDKAKLEQRLDDLLEELWHIGDKRREENVHKMARIKEEESLVECTDVLLQHHSTLIQVEVERFQNTLGILKTYDLSMCKQTMPDIVQKESLCSKIKSHGLTEHAKPLLRENLIRDAEEANKTISNGIEALLLNREARRSKDKKEINSSTDRNSFPALNQSPNHETAIIDIIVQNKVYDECLAALLQDGDATKVRIALIMAHGFKMLKSLQRTADQMLNAMEELMKEQLMAEMKSIDHVAEVVRHHMESDPKLQNGLDLVSSYSLQTVSSNSVTAPPVSS